MQVIMQDEQRLLMNDDCSLSLSRSLLLEALGRLVPNSESLGDPEPGTYTFNLKTISTCHDHDIMNDIGLGTDRYRSVTVCSGVCLLGHRQWHSCLTLKSHEIGATNHRAPEQRNSCK